jgi:hypothetical protein
MSIFTTMQEEMINEMERDQTVTEENNTNTNNLMVLYENARPKKLDKIVSSVIRKFKQRARFGQRKYGTDLDREDLTFLDWIQHAQEEHMDAILYLEKIKQTEEKRLASTSSENITYLYVLIYLLITICFLLSMNHIIDKMPI